MTSPNQPAPEGARSYEQIAGLRTVQVPKNIDQGLYDQAEAMRGSFLGNILSGFASIGQAIGNALSDIASALFGNYTGSNPALVQMSDGMTDLNGRIDLMANVPGYAGAIMTQNHRFGSGGVYKRIPFNKRYGPEKNATVNTSNNRIYMSQGSWSAHFTISTSSGNGGIGHGLRAQVRDENGTVVITRTFDWQNAGATWDQHFAMPIVAPKSGWSIELGYRHSGNWWTILGGTEKTLMWVERKNLDADNHEVVQPTDGADIE